MRTTSNQDREFIQSVISTSLLEESIDYIKDTFSMEEVYGEDILHEWALENGYVKEE